MNKQSLIDTNKWSCPQCSRVFNKTNQVHTCRKTPLEYHFRNKEVARDLFSILVDRINTNVGGCKIISLPCCVHLFGTYEFLAALPKKDRLEVRFALDRVLRSPRLKTSTPLSHKYFKNCIDIGSKEEIDTELVVWLNEAYHLRDK